MDKISTRTKLFEKIITASEDESFIDDVNNAEDVSSFVDNFIDNLVDKQLDSISNDSDLI